MIFLAVNKTIPGQFAGAHSGWKDTRRAREERDLTSHRFVLQDTTAVTVRSVVHTRVSQTQFGEEGRGIGSLAKFTISHCTPYHRSHRTQIVPTFATVPSKRLTQDFVRMYTEQKLHRQGEREEEEEAGGWSGKMKTGSRFRGAKQHPPQRRLRVFQLMCFGNGHNFSPHLLDTILMTRAVKKKKKPCSGPLPKSAVGHNRNVDYGRCGMTNIVSFVCREKPNSPFACGRQIVMDDTLTIVSLEPMTMVTELNRKSLRALEKSGHHTMCREGIRKSQASSTVPVFVSYVRLSDPNELGSLALFSSASSSLIALEPSGSVVQ